MASSIFTQRAIQDLHDYSLIFYGELLREFQIIIFFKTLTLTLLNRWRRRQALPQIGERERGE
jgi:hypothetical protein